MRIWDASTRTNSYKCLINLVTVLGRALVVDVGSQRLVKCELLVPFSLRASCLTKKMVIW